MKDKRKPSCLTCNGEGRLKVGWSQAPRSTYKIRVEYDPCPRCTKGPHTFHAEKVAAQIDAIAKAEGGERSSPRAAPKVKALEWSKYDEARCLGMAWYFYETRPGEYNVVRCAPDNERLGTGVTKPEAMQLGQDDCERRILDALE